VTSEGHFFSLDGPLDTMPIDRQIRAATLSGFGELVRGLGADPRSILERHSIDPRAMRDPDLYIDSMAVVDLLENYSRLRNDPLFGMRLGEFQEADVSGPVATLCRSASTFREALHCYAKFIPVVHCPLVQVEVVEGTHTAELRWSTRKDLGQADQAQSKGAFICFKLLRQVGGRLFKPSYVSLSVDVRQRDLPAMESRFGCTVHGRSPVNVIAFPAGMLDGAVPSANRLLFKLLGGYLERVRASSRHSLAERVEDYVRGALSSGNCSIEQCARKLGRPMRTLQTSLSELGLSFSEILEAQRIELAKTCLAQGEITLDDVAAMLGYSEQSSFGRAFKRWTGATPRSYRRQLEAPRVA